MLSNVHHRHAVEHKLTVDGEDWSDRLLDASVQFRADAGSSGMEFSVTGSAEEYKDSVVNFWLGSSHHTQSYSRPYFVGTLQGPNDDERLDTSTVRAFGPFKDMAEQVLGTNETFQGNTLEWVILNCARRTQRRPGDIIVRNGNTYKVQQGEQFPFDNKIADVLSSLMEKANFVGVDQPGGRREFMPRPRPGSNEVYSRTLDMDDYTEFSLNPSNETNFSKVVVYRNGDNGKPVVYAERDVNPISNRPPPKNRWYVVSDFPGTQKEAGDEAFRLALELRMGLSTFSITMPFDRNLKVFGGLRVSTIKKQQSRTYSCFIDDGFTVDYSPGSPALMSVGGKSYEITKDRKHVHVPEKRVVVAPSIAQRPSTLSFTPASTPINIEAEGDPATSWPNSYSDPVPTFRQYANDDWWTYVGTWAPSYWVDQAHGAFDTSAIPDNAIIESASLTVFVRARNENTPDNRYIEWYWHPWNTALSNKDRFIFEAGGPRFAGATRVDDVTANQSHTFILGGAASYINKSGLTGVAAKIYPQTQVAHGSESYVRMTSRASGDPVNPGFAPILKVYYRLPEGL